MSAVDTESQIMSIMLINDDQEQKKKEPRSFHRYRNACTGEYLSIIGVPILILITVIILIIIFRENN
jgi:hypothetical protein